MYVVGLQQVVLKWAASDISVLMQIALRSALSAIMVYPLIQQSVRRQLLSTRYLPAGLLVGILFATEFYLIGEALRYTSASHTIVSTLQTDALWGDFLALLGGIFWAATTVSVRLSRLAEAPATQTLFYQLLMGGILLLPLAFFSGQATIQWTTLSISSLIFHTMLISFASYLIWFWMLKHYLASRLGVFSFLTPVFGMLFGVLILDEQIELNFIVGTCMVMLGVILVSLQGWLKKPNTTNNPQEQT